MFSSVISLCFVILLMPVSFGFNTTLVTKALNVQAASLKAFNSSSFKSFNETNEIKLLTAKSSNFKSTKTPETIYDYDDDYDDYETDEESGYENENSAARNNTKRRRIFILKRVGITFAWGRWEKWSRCSKSCVQIRKRQCIKRIQNASDSEALEITFYPNLTDQTTGCMGIMKKYRLCKDEKCKFTNRQMRDEQCATFNRQPLKGKFFNWQGYEKEHNECELYCKPLESDMFISMNQSVTDGTPCEKPAIYYTHYYRRKAVCVEGICKMPVLLYDHDHNEAN